MSERWDTFTRIWAKGRTNKMVQRLMEKVKIRGLEPTEDNCRDYWMGYIRHYIDGWTGQSYHVNPRKNKVLMKQLRRNKNEQGNRRERKGKSSHEMGGRYQKKKRPIRRRK
jgi:hypothetical protein